MTVERIPVGDRAAWLAVRGQDVTASTIGCLFGIHDYLTVFELFALKTGRITEDPEETPPMQRGRLLEPVAVQLLREMHPDWKITHNDGPGRVYLRDADARIGATVDVFAVDPARGPGVVQIKTVEHSVYARKWRDPDTREVTPPLWIAVQAITEAHLAGATWAAVAPLTVGFGLDMPLIEVPIHSGIIDRSRQAVADFWTMIAEGRQPEPDYGRDGDLIERLFAQDFGTEIDLSTDNMLPGLVRERAGLKADIKRLDSRVDEIDTEVKSKLGNHAAARIAGGKYITWREQTRRAYAVRESTYRVLRYPKGESE